MSLQSRLSKINQIANASTTRQIYVRNKCHKAYYCESLRNGNPFQVILNWSKQNGILTLTASLFSYEPKEQPHPANKSHTLCYQVLGIAKRMAKEAGKILSLCKSEEAARNLLRLGGQLVKIQNQNGAVVWATVR